MNAERWLPVSGYEGCYDVSDLGRVRSWRRSGAPNLFRDVPFVLKSNTNTGTGYLTVTLCKDGGKATTNVHQMVMAAFVGPRPDGQQVRHLDGNRTNARLLNLAYGTASENMHDTIRHGTNRNARKTHCPASHLYDDTNTRVEGTTKRHCRECEQRRTAARRQAVAS